MAAKPPHAIAVRGAVLAAIWRFANHPGYSAPSSGVVAGPAEAAAIGQERPFDITRRIVDNRYVDGGYRMLISDNL